MLAAKWQYMSPKDIPAVAKHGLPKKPCRNHGIVVPDTLSTVAAPMVKRTNMMENVTICNGVLPTEGSH
jgi:hypothetical protein